MIHNVSNPRLPGYATVQTVDKVERVRVPAAQPNTKLRVKPVVHSDKQAYAYGWKCPTVQDVAALAERKLQVIALPYDRERRVRVNARNLRELKDQRVDEIAPVARMTRRDRRNARAAAFNERRRLEAARQA